MAEREEERDEGDLDQHDEPKGQGARAAEEPADKGEAEAADDAEAEEDADAADEAEERDEEEEEDDELGRERARKAAAALGVGEDKERGQKAAPQNRAERRRARAMQRRGQKPGDEAPPEKDRNRRAREQVLRGKQPLAEGEPSDVSLAVDDALARGGAAAVNWLKRNGRWMQWAIAAGIVGGIGFGVYSWRVAKVSAAASDELAAAVAADDAFVLPPAEDKRSDDDKKHDTRLIFSSYAERDKTALAAYQKAAADRPGSGTSILAELGLAGVDLDSEKWDDALTAYDKVLTSKLAEADVDVKGRALEGEGFAYEGKKDLDKAEAAFAKLADLPAPMFKALSKYHRARVLAAKGDKDQAKKLLQEAQKDIETDRLEVAAVSHGTMNGYGWLGAAVDDALGRIDPSAQKPKFMPGQMPQGLSPEQVKALLKLKQQGLLPALSGNPIPKPPAPAKP